MVADGRVCGGLGRNSRRLQRSFFRAQKEYPSQYKRVSLSDWSISTHLNPPSMMTMMTKMTTGPHTPMVTQIKFWAETSRMIAKAPSLH